MRRNWAGGPLPIRRSVHRFELRLTDRWNRTANPICIYSSEAFQTPDVLRNQTYHIPQNQFVSSEREENIMSCIRYAWVNISHRISPVDWRTQSWIDWLSNTAFATSGIMDKINDKLCLYYSKVLRPPKQVHSLFVCVCVYACVYVILRVTQATLSGASASDSILKCPQGFTMKIAVIPTSHFELRILETNRLRNLLNLIEFALIISSCWTLCIRWTEIATWTVKYHVV